MSRREPRIGNTLVHKLRQNWYWVKTRGWADVIEEHDIDPLVRGRRAFRKARWRWLDRDRPARAIPVFLVGAQRSGTNMLAHALDEAPELQVFNEGNAKAFRNFRIRSFRTIESLIERSPAAIVLFKPLCDSHKARDLLVRFSPARVIWAYREVDGRVRSAVAKFGDSNLRALGAYAAGEHLDAWQVQGLSENNIALIRSFDYDRLSAESGAALFWYVRNSLYFDLGLDRRDDTILASYDHIVEAPEEALGTVCAFLGLPYRSSLVSYITPRAAWATEPLAIDGRIRDLCTRMQRRLDAVSVQQASRFIRAEAG
jgi:hypothetical protein